ncbi:MAG: DUF412 domain-containing protein [Algicola sp.]|nr:DUF412 domain-containing protein [Algicola sp.]
MQQDMLALIRDGQTYSKTWPLKRELAAIFMEYRMIKATKLGIDLLPLLAILSLMVQVTLLGFDYMPQAIACSLFMLSIPVQGFYWLGKRANTPLPQSMANWYHQIHQQMTEEGCHLPATSGKPRYQELAVLLKQAFEKMDKAFTKDMF